MKVAPRVQGKIIEVASGKRCLVVEQKGRDIWRGKHKTLHEAVEAGDAAAGVDRILLQRSQRYQCEAVMIVVEEFRKLYFAPIPAFFDETKARTRANWQGRSHRLLGFENLKHYYLGPCLKRKRKRATA